MKLLIILSTITILSSCTTQNDFWSELDEPTRKTLSKVTNKAQYNALDELTRHKVDSTAKSINKWYENLYNDLEVVALETDSISKARGYGISVSIHR